MKKIFLFILLMACMTKNPLKEMRFEVVSVNQVAVATWYRISDTASPLIVYVNADQYLVRKDTSENILYIDRPCQIIRSSFCPLTQNEEMKLISSVIEKFKKRFAFERIVRK